MSLRTVCCALLLCTLALLLAGCPPKEQTTAGGPANQPGPGPTTEARYHIPVIPKGTAHIFWESVRAGAEAAGREFGARISWNGPSVETDIEGQKRIVENFITQGVDALVLAACDKDALNTTLAKAKEDGVVIVTIDSGISDDTIPVSFVATDNYAGGREAAKKLAELIGDRGEVGLIPFIQGAVSSDEREAGFEDEINENHPNIERTAKLYCQSDVEKGQSVTENMLTGHPELDGIFACNEPGGVGAARVFHERGLAGKIKLVSFDSSDTLVDALADGTIQALIVQNPYQMGYQGVECAVKALQGESVEAFVDTGVTVVTKENMIEDAIQEVLYPLGRDWKP